MTTITTATGEAFFLIDRRHEPFVHERSPYLNDHRLSWWQRFVIFALVITAGWLLAGQLLVDTVRADAVILEKAEGPEFDTYFVTYTFTIPDGETITIEQAISYDLFTGLETGDTVRVQYQPGNVENTRMIERNAATIAENSILLSLTVLLIVTALYVLAFWIIRPDQRNRLLETEGVLLRGKITEIYPRKQPRRYLVHVEFECKLPDDTTLTAKAVRNRRDLERNVLPTLGTAVLVLYVKEGVYRLM